ncbi:hypothetical protein NUW54_g6166 [Trametes sanguinea]|uniref:Uncharacterized protein n=1 Tax=Trametes sanguinea TaxID=158606 RepID=A0ACC1PWD5_9APHY|nr:hypothetical protein NUW54_g6166 [Trametes sanguinea]
MKGAARLELELAEGGVLDELRRSACRRLPASRLPRRSSDTTSRSSRPSQRRSMSTRCVLPLMSFQLVSLPSLVFISCALRFGVCWRGAGERLTGWAAMAVERKCDSHDSLVVQDRSVVHYDTHGESDSRESLDKKGDPPLVQEMAKVAI